MMTMKMKIMAMMVTMKMKIMAMMMMMMMMIMTMMMMMTVSVCSARTKICHQREAVSRNPAHAPLSCLSSSS